MVTAAAGRGFSCGQCSMCDKKRAWPGQEAPVQYTQFVAHLTLVLRAQAQVLWAQVSCAEGALQRTQLCP